ILARLGAKPELKAIIDSGVSEDKEGVSTPTGAVRVAVAGATGYSGGELVSILLRHPFARITRLMRDSSRFPTIETAHPSLRGMDLPVCEQSPAATLRASDADVVFLCTPHEAAHDAVPGLL